MIKLVFLGPVLVEPESCWRCGAGMEQDILEITSFDDARPRYIVGRTWCSTPGCVPICPGCRQPASDDETVYVHGPECGPIMWTKSSGTPHLVEACDTR